MHSLFIEFTSLFIDCNLFISVHVHFRRLIYTTDPQYPTVLASGTMPSLTLHVNEQKVDWSINVSNLILIFPQPVVMDSSENIFVVRYQNLVSAQ